MNFIVCEFNGRLAESNWFYYGLSPNTAPAHVGGHEILRTSVIMCGGHPPSRLFDSSFKF